jgi:hypothetical protein
MVSEVASLLKETKHEEEDIVASALAVVDGTQRIELQREGEGGEGSTPVDCSTISCRS